METAVPLPTELVDLLAEALPNLSDKQRSLLSVDIAGLWWGLRTAVLIDCATLEQSEAESLGVALRANHNYDLFVAFEPSSGQTLAINAEYAKSRWQGISFCTEVGGSEPVLLPKLPAPACALLASIRTLRGRGDPFVLLLPVSNPLDLVPAVGHLIDYMFPYAVSNEDGRNCLGGVELEVCEAFLTSRDSGRKHRLLSFSYPTQLCSGASARVSSELIKQTMEALLSARLDEARGLYPEMRACAIEVMQSRRTMERVAL
ncbi:hypothetical protein JCM10207_000678 [Rhodosporidiobolus poonsookiae]